MCSERSGFVLLSALGPELSSEEERFKETWEDNIHIDNSAAEVEEEDQRSREWYGNTDRDEYQHLETKQYTT